MADFLFDKRFLIDKHIKYAYKIENGEPIPVDVPNPVSPRIVYCDIEVLSPQGVFPDAKNAAFPIITIQVMDSIIRKIVVFTSDVVLQTSDPCHIVCKNERDLIRSFCSYIKIIDPDIVTGWNFEQFDIPYLINRARNLSVSLSGFSRSGQCRTEYDPSTGEFNNKIGGRVCLDMMAAFKKYSIGMGQRESFSLKSIINDKELLDKTDKDGNIIESFAFEYNDLGPILQKVIEEQRYDDLIEYCKNDVIALYNIDTSLGLYMYFESIRFIAGNKISDSLFNSKIIEMLLLHEGIRPMPTKIYKEQSNDKFTGALVITPSAGIHEYVQTVDVSSMYPNIMVGFNVNPDIDGIVVQAMKKIMALREHYRSLKKQGIKGADILDSGTKAIANSFYGVLGSPAFRLYNRDNALFVTSTGQEINRYIQSECLKLQKSIIYGDTDSVFISKVFTSSEAIEIENYLNKKLADWCDEKGCAVHITLKAEKLFRRILFKASSKDRNKSSKKKYAGYLIWHEGHDTSELSFMGLELKRSDNSVITKNCLKYFLEAVLIDGDLEKAAEFVRNQYRLVKSGSVNIYDISIPKEIRKIKYDTKNSWIEGIDVAKRVYKHFIAEGTKPRLLYLKHGVICIDDTFPVEKIADLIDYEKMADKVIKSKLESYLWAIGKDWNSVVRGQKSVTDFF
ncbi:MAG TPA: DNA polymerase domain-containing protein [Methanospirillum sp.]|nr:DNA polymerase domain-containing protein [Methanospirillum sp.]